MVVYKSDKYNQPTYSSLSLDCKNIREAKDRMFQKGANVLRKPTRMPGMVNERYTRPKRFFLSPIRRRVLIKKLDVPPSLIYAYFEKRGTYPGRFI